MNVVFCTTCKGRTQHLEKTLPQNLKDNARARFVVLDYNDAGELPEYLRREHAGDIESGRLSVYSLHEPGAPFRMAHAKNMAHRLGVMEGGEVLVNIDADNFTGCGFDDYLLENFSGNGNAFMWARMVKGENDRGISGRIAVRSTSFLNAGGYDEQYAKWGPDDKDFNTRLRRMGLSGVEIDPRFLKAILHTDKMRFKEYKDAANGEEDFAGVHESEATVVNFGNIGTGVVFKNFDYENPISVPRIPTRVFGIGMHKTATTSLHHALQILGLDSAHWKSAHWAKHVWEEIQTWGRSATLEQNYAVCDLPIPMMFKQLDLAYPGSKFILTVRDEEGWIDTVEKHWNPEHNHFRASWNHDPFSHRCHRLLYGHKDFRRDSMLQRYRRHNAEVLEYFQNRPGDLLVMKMHEGAGWRELAGFLGRPIPKKPYPQAYAEY